jgi:hypothetical protein
VDCFSCSNERGLPVIGLMIAQDLQHALKGVWQLDSGDCRSSTYIQVIHQFRRPSHRRAQPVVPDFRLVAHNRPACFCDRRFICGGRLDHTMEKITRNFFFISLTVSRCLEAHLLPGYDLIRRLVSGRRRHGVQLVSAPSRLCLHGYSLFSVRLAWARTARWSLPISLVLPILSLFIALAGPLTTLVLARVDSRIINLVKPHVRYVLPFAPAIFLILAMVYGLPSTLLSCELESQWTSLFRQKNAQAIRIIENELHCCGFNSIHDRAWPFPSREVDVRACERDLGYVQPCIGPWRRQEQIAAGLVFTANFFTWIVLVSARLNDN